MHSLTLALGGGEWSASHLGHFTPRKESLVQLDRGWAGGPYSRYGRGSEEKNP